MNLTSKVLAYLNNRSRGASDHIADETLAELTGQRGDRAHDNVDAAFPIA